MTQGLRARLRVPDRPWRPAERWCIAGAAICLGWLGWTWLDGARWQVRELARLSTTAAAGSADPVAGDREIHSTLPPIDLSEDGPRWALGPGDPDLGADVGGGSPTTLPGDAVPVYAVAARRAGDTALPPMSTDPALALGELSLPRLGLRWAVAEGVAADSLRRAPGWIPGTARPGSPGNVGIAGHRDRHFRRLGEIAVGDELVLAGPHGPRRYRVEWTRVVSRRDVGVLAPTDHDAVTLVTCYPFRWTGPAPERFIVRAVAAGRSKAELDPSAAPQDGDAARCAARLTTARPSPASAAWSSSPARPRRRAAGAPSGAGGGSSGRG